LAAALSPQTTTASADTGAVTTAWEDSHNLVGPVLDNQLAAAVISMDQISVLDLLSVPEPSLIEHAGHSSLDASPKRGLAEAAVVISMEALNFNEIFA
jgi:hypothetical protein